MFHAIHINYHHILGKKGGGQMVEDAAIDKSPEFCKNIVLLVISYFVREAFIYVLAEFVR